MNDEQIPHQFQVIRQLMATLQQKDVVTCQEFDTALEDLQVSCEQMQTDLETAQAIEEELLQQKQHYQNLFQFSPFPYLLTNANGVILEANQAIAQLLNVPHVYLLDKPLIAFVVEGDRSTFRPQLSQLSQSLGIQIWQVNLCPHNGDPVVAVLHITILHHRDGRVENLRIGVYNLGS